jgi:hypothetical protein
MLPCINENHGKTLLGSFKDNRSLFIKVWFGTDYYSQNRTALFFAKSNVFDSKPE